MKAIYFVLFVALILMGGIIESCDSVLALLGWAMAAGIVCLGLYELRDIWQQEGGKQ